MKFPVLKSSFWFSALARPKPTVSTERIKVRSLPKTNRTAHRENLWEKMSKSDSQNCKDKTLVEIRFLLSNCILKQPFLTVLQKGFWNKTLGKCFIYHILGDCITYEHISGSRSPVKEIFDFFFSFSWFSVYVYDNYSWFSELLVYRTILEKAE